MCFTLIAAWECFRYLRGSRRFTDLLKIAAASALAILSHYYAAIYLFFLCVVIGVLLMSRKNWRDLCMLYIAEGAAVLAAVAVFPAMVNRILNSSRGVQATENLASTDLGDYGDRLSVYSTGIDASFFGGLFLALLALAAVLLLLWVLKRKKGTLPAPSREERGMSPAELCVLLVPAVCYFFLVSKYLPIRTSGTCIRLRRSCTCPSSRDWFSSARGC